MSVLLEGEMSTIVSTWLTFQTVLRSPLSQDAGTGCVAAPLSARCSKKHVSNLNIQTNLNNQDCLGVRNETIALWVPSQC